MVTGSFEGDKSKGGAEVRHVQNAAAVPVRNERSAWDSDVSYLVC